MDVLTVPCQWPEGDCKIAIVGEAPGSDEGMLGKPFVGRSGKLLNKMLTVAGIERKECLVTNVFDFVLPNNSVKPISVKKKKVQASWWPQIKIPVESGCYMPRDIAVPQLRRLFIELEECNPNIILALGGTAVWALLGIAPYGKMKKMRGTIMEGLNGSKVLATYHPAYLTRAYSEKPLVEADLRKLKYQSTFPEIRYPIIDIVIPKRVYEVTSFIDSLGPVAAVDIETFKGTIDNIGFADCFERAMSIPIYNAETQGSYWPTWKDEAIVLLAIVDYLQDPTKIKVFQNGSYDIQWMWEKWGVQTANWTEDTRLLHHSLWPESPKDLGTIASLHLDMPSWKLAGAGRATTKKED